MISSCQENTEDPAGELLDVGIEISVKSAEGVDLLNPQSPGHIEENKIRIFKLVNGENVEVYDPNMDSPRGFMIFEHASEFRIRIFGNESSTDEYPITYVKWNESDTDTLKYQIIRKNDNSCVSISKVWFNSIEVWDQETDKDERHFEIIK
jgi:hypothetical protein